MGGGSWGFARSGVIQHHTVCKSAGKFARVVDINPGLYNNRSSPIKTHITTTIAAIKHNKRNGLLVKYCSILDSDSPTFQSLFTLSGPRHFDIVFFDAVAEGFA